MGKEKLSAEEKLEKQRKYDEGCQAAEKELMRLFDSGVPMSALDDIFEDDQHFWGVSKEWDSAIDMFIEKHAPYCQSIYLRGLMEQHLKELPETTSVYWIHDINYEFEGWVIGDISVAQECVRGKVKHDLRVEYDSWYQLDDETADAISDSYGIEKISVGEHSTYIAHRTSFAPMKEELWEGIKYNPHVGVDDYDAD